jgi:hypothetical protein
VAREISFGDFGQIEVDEVERAVVRFPTDEEQLGGMTEVPRAIRIQEYAMKNTKLL